MTLEHQLAKSWIKQNRTLLRKYRGQWIAYNGQEGLLGHDKDVSRLAKSSKEMGKPFILKYIDPIFYSGLRRLVPIRFRPLRQESWAILCASGSIAADRLFEAAPGIRMAVRNSHCNKK